METVESGFASLQDKPLDQLDGILFDLAKRDKISWAEAENLSDSGHKVCINEFRMEEDTERRLREGPDSVKSCY